MNTLINVFAGPSETFGTLRLKPAWRAAVLLFIAGFFLLVWLGGCWSDLSQALQWTNLLGPALISPVVVGIVSLGTTTLIYLLNLILGDRETRSTSFKTLYSVNIHCGAIFLLGEVVNFLLIRTPVLGDHPTPLSGRFPVGLDVFLLGVDDPNLYLSIILHSTSVFLIWYLVVLAMGIRTVTGTSKMKSAIIAASLWCAIVGLALGAVYAAGGGTTIRIRL
jgi:hypothetical protein